MCWLLQIVEWMILFVKFDSCAELVSLHGYLFATKWMVTHGGCVAILVGTPYTIRAEDHVSTWSIRLAALTRYHAPHLLLCIIFDVSSTTHQYYLLRLHGGPSRTSLNSLRNLYEHCRRRRIHNTVFVIANSHSKAGITSHVHMALKSDKLIQYPANDKHNHR